MVSVAQIWLENGRNLEAWSCLRFSACRCCSSDLWAASLASSSARLKRKYIYIYHNISPVLAAQVEFKEKAACCNYKYQKIKETSRNAWRELCQELKDWILFCTFARLPIPPPIVFPPHGELPSQLPGNNQGKRFCHLSFWSQTWIHA